MAMENEPFEDVFPIENGGFSIAMFDYRSLLITGDRGPPGTPWLTPFFPGRALSSLDKSTRRR